MCLLIGDCELSNQPKALITGITGQTGSYLAELLLSKGYDVHGVIRRTSSPNIDRIKEIASLITLHPADLTDESSLIRVIDSVRPQEVYNLAAQSFVKVSWDTPIYTGEVTGLGVTKILEAIRTVDKNIRFYQASSSELFGKVLETPQKETTPFYPRSPYGVAKMYGHWMTINYRESYDMFACCGIIFNHESERRGLEFVTRKITHTAARIKCGLETELRLGNLDAKRDWSHASDMAEAMWLMLQQDKPKDYVFASGEVHTVREFVKLTFERLDLDYNDHVIIDSKFFRPAEVEILLGDSSLARKELKWSPKVSFEDLVYRMVDSDLKLIQQST